MKAIVAVDLNWGIGCDGELLESIPEDMKFFKEKTKNNIIVMGRETFESLPGKAPLKNRINIVLTRNKSFDDDRLKICNSVEETLEVLKQYSEDDVFIIGGEAIYKAFLPYCNEIFLTKIGKTYKADKFFPNIDQDEAWILDNEGEQKEYNGIRYNFNTYKRKIEY